MPRFRTGHRVPLNVYDGDRPIFQAHSEQDAERFVALMNLGERIETVTAAEIAQHIEGAFDDLAAKLALDGLPSGRTVAEHLAPVVMAEVLLVSHQSHLSVPESPSEPPPATGQREILDAGPQKRCEYSVATHVYCGKKAQAWWAESTAPDARRRMLCWEDGAAHEQWGWHMDGMWSE